jgi:chromatin assembly factor 1 subunit A
MDKYVEQSPEPSPSVIQSFANLKARRGFQPPKVEHVIQQLQGSPDDPVDLTKDTAHKPIDVLKSIPLKFFFYGEDVRPPYLGTWTRTIGNNLARKLALNPLAQQLPKVDYSYDSEAEWDDADEGEDIDVEDNEKEDEDEEEMEGFIDDDNAPQYLARRGLPASDVEPKCSGIQWEDASGKLKSADPKHEDANFSEFAVSFLLGKDIRL